jgi:hypothetical protein
VGHVRQLPPHVHRFQDLGVRAEAEQATAGGLAVVEAEDQAVPAGLVRVSELGWYADFVAGDERVVVFAGKVFRHRRGDEAGRAEAVAYGQSVGTPGHQLDWEE